MYSLKNVGHSLEFALGYSRILFLLITFSYLGGIGIFLTLPIPLILKIGGGALLGFSYFQTLKTHVFRKASRSVIRIWQDSKGRFGCHFRYGLSALGELQGDSFKSAWLIILRLRLKDRKISVIIPKDILTPHEFRALLLRLNQNPP